MDWSGLPPLASLRAFEAAARNLNYSAAGRELNVSHAAIAQQVRALEAHLGLRLAQRSGRGLALTPEGQTLAEGLSDGFGRVGETVRALAEKEAGRPLHVTMTPSFAVSWFLPRMPLFREAHPEIDLIVNPTADLIDLADGGYDIAIRYGNGIWPGCESELLLPSNFIIVAAPELIPEGWRGTPDELVALPWLQELGTEEVKQWLQEQDIVLPESAHFTNLPGYMLLGALRGGQGAAATARVFVQDDIDAGRLLVLHEVFGDTTNGYHLVWRPGIERPALKLFKRWIRGAARETA